MVAAVVIKLVSKLLAVMMVASMVGLLRAWG